MARPPLSRRRRPAKEREQSEWRISPAFWALRLALLGGLLLSGANAIAQDGFWHRAGATFYKFGDEMSAANYTCQYFSSGAWLQWVSQGPTQSSFKCTSYSTSRYINYTTCAAIGSPGYEFDGTACVEPPPPVDCATKPPVKRVWYEGEADLPTTWTDGDGCEYVGAPLPAQPDCGMMATFGANALTMYCTAPYVPSGNMGAPNPEPPPGNGTNPAGGSPDEEPTVESPPAPTTETETEAPTTEFDTPGPGDVTTTTETTTTTTTPGAGTRTETETEITMERQGNTIVTTTTTTTTTTKPDGTTTTVQQKQVNREVAPTTTTTLNKGNLSTSTTTGGGGSSSGTTTTTSISNPDGSGNSSTTIEGDPEGQDESNWQGGTSVMPGVNPDGWWESAYPDGLGGIWNDRFADLQQTQFFEDLAGFGQGVPDSGSCPSFEFPSFWLLGGGGSIQPPCFIWDAMRAIVLISAAFASRRIIFGG